MKTKYLYYYLHRNKTNPPLDNLPTLQSLKKTYILYLLKITAHNLKETAEILHISLGRMRKIVREYKLPSVSEDSPKSRRSGDCPLG